MQLGQVNRAAGWGGDETREMWGRPGDTSPAIKESG